MSRSEYELIRDWVYYKDKAELFGLSLSSDDVTRTIAISRFKSNLEPIGRVHLEKLGAWLEGYEKGILSAVESDGAKSSVHIEKPRLPEGTIRQENQNPDT